MWRVLLGEFWDDLGHQKTRVLLTTFAIAWGTLTVVVLLALGEGLKQQVLTELVSAYDQVIAIRGGVSGLPYKGLGPGRPIRFTEDDVGAIGDRIQAIDALSPVYARSNVTKTAGQIVAQRGQVQGVYPDYGRLRKIASAAGSRFINNRDLDGRRRVVFLGDSLAAQLFPEGDAMGSSLLLNSQVFTVVGVEEARAEAGLESVEQRFNAFIPASTFVAVFGDRTVGQILLRPRDSDAKQGLEEELRLLLGARHRFDPQDTRALWFTDYEEQARAAWTVLTGIQLFMGMIGGLTLLAAGVGIANIMYVAVHERTMEIGVKLAIGARRPHIMAQFVFESLVLSFAGGTAGLAMAGAAVWLVRMLPKEQEVLAYLVHPEVSWSIGIATALVLALIGLLAGFFPARRAAAMDPVEALRYE